MDILILIEILAASIAESEDSGFWLIPFRSLKDKGLDGTEMGFKRQWNLHLLELPGSTGMSISSGQFWRAFPKKDKQEIA